MVVLCSEDDEDDEEDEDDDDDEDECAMMGGTGEVRSCGHGGDCVMILGVLYGPGGEEHRVAVSKTGSHWSVRLGRSGQ